MGDDSLPSAAGQTRYCLTCREETEVVSLEWGSDEIGEPAVVLTLLCGHAYEEPDREQP